MTNGNNKESFKDAIIGNLWQKKSPKGNTYYQGNIKINGETIFVNLFKNTKKISDRSPDLIITKNNYTKTIDNNKN